MTLKQRLAAPGIVLAPGVYDAFTAMLAERAGFEALYLSGASVAYTRLGRPDIGLVTETELEETLSRIAERVTTPVIVDADTGLRQRAQRAAHREAPGARRRGGDPARGPEPAQALRPPRREAAGGRRRDDRQGVDFDELQRLLGTADMLALGKRYDDPGA